MKETFQHIFRSYKETTGLLQSTVVFLLAILTAGISVIEPVIFTQIIAYIEVFYKTGYFDVNGALKHIIFWAIFIIFSIMLSFVFRYFFLYKNNMKNYVGNCKKFNSKLVYMGYPEYLGKKQGSLYKIYDRGTQGQESFLYFFIGDFIKNVSGISIIIVILFITDYRMALLSLSMIPVMILLGYFFVKKLSVSQKILNDKWDSMFGDIGNIFSSFSLTKSLLIEKTFLRQMSNTLDDLLIKQNKLGKGWSFVNIYTGFLVMVSRILVLGFGMYYVIDGSLSFSALFLVFSFIGWIYFPLAGLIDRFNDIVKHLTSVEKMYSEFENIPGEDLEKGKNIKATSGSILFKNVIFGYDEKQSILKNISFEIKPGEKIALVGNTGAGKSTIVNLLLRFWDVSHGSIELDVEDIRNIKKSSLRKHIGVVSQDNSLFNLSIEENLKFANPKATHAQINEALLSAEADFVFDLPLGLKTVIGERGMKLSGGEKQRISIARLFLKNPEILILDEATSALDNITEQKIEKALKKLMKGKTSIIIAHRLSTIRHVDRIFVLEKGKIVEVGKYEELIKNKGKFFQLANPDKLILG